MNQSWAQLTVSQKKEGKGPSGRPLLSKRRRDLILMRKCKAKRGTGRRLKLEPAPVWTSVGKGKGLLNSGVLIQKY